MKRWNRSAWLCLLLAPLLALFLGAGCGGPSTMGSSKAAQGAETGAAVGAVGGILLGLVAGERRLGDAALAGAAVGATAGAVAGAASGGQTDDEIKKEIGEKNHEGLMYLVNCQYGFALRIAEEEQKSSTNPTHKLAALWLEVLVTADQDDKERLADLYEIVVEEDRDVDSIEKARKETKRGLMELRDYRVEMGKPRRCR